MTPFDEGKAARWQGFGEDENPYHYHEEPEEWNAWLDGWVEAVLEEQYISSETYVEE